MKLESAATESSRGLYFKGMFHRPGVPIMAILFQGPWAMSGDSFSCYNWGGVATSICLGGASDDAEHPPVHRMTTTKDGPAKMSMAPRLRTAGLSPSWS